MIRHMPQEQQQLVAYAFNHIHSCDVDFLYDAVVRRDYDSITLENLLTQYDKRGDKPALFSLKNLSNSELI